MAFSVGAIISELWFPRSFQWAPLVGTHKSLHGLRYIDEPVFSSVIAMPSVLQSIALMSLSFSFSIRFASVISRWIAEPTIFPSSFKIGLAEPPIFKRRPSLVLLTNSPFTTFLARRVSRMVYKPQKVIILISGYGVFFPALPPCYIHTFFECRIYINYRSITISYEDSFIRSLNPSLNFNNPLQRLAFGDVLIEFIKFVISPHSSRIYDGLTRTGNRSPVFRMKTFLFRSSYPASWF